MQYRIEYADGRSPNFANSPQILIAWLKTMEADAISDIRKVYKSGVSYSVMETYKPYIGK